MKAPHCPQAGSSCRISSSPLRTAVVLTACGVAILVPVTAQAQRKTKPAQKSAIEIVSPTATAKQELVSTGGSVKIVYKVNDDDIDGIRFKIDAPPYDAASGSAEFKREGSHTFIAKLFKGRNTIHLFGFNGSDAVKTAAADVVVFCNNECAGSSPPKEGGGTPDEKPGTQNVTIVKPQGGETVTDVKSVQRTIVVQKK